MKRDNVKRARTAAERAPLATPGEIVLVLLTLSFFLTLLAPSILAR